MTLSTAGRASNEAGFTLIDILFVIAILGLLATAAIPGLTRARSVAQSASALGTLQVINSAQLSYAITCGLGFYAPDFTVLTAPPPASSQPFLPPELATGVTFVKAGYNFSMAGTAQAGAPATCNGLGMGASVSAYAAVADYLGANPNARFFGTNADGIIYEHNLSLAAIMPETGPPPAGSAIK